MTEVFCRVGARGFRIMKICRDWEPVARHLGLRQASPRTSLP
jgi:hypothetical protein